MDTNEAPDSSSADLDPQAAFVELGAIMLGNMPLDETLEHISRLAIRALPEIDEVSVTMMNGESPRTVVFTGPLAASLDERQYEVGFGPCTDAATSGRTIVVDHRDPQNAYPDYAATALAAGIAHTVSVGLPVPQRVIGGLNMYASTERAIDPDTVQLAQTFAGYAAVAIANAALYSSTADLARNIQVALSSRAVIDQAKGILMARLHLSAGDAFSNLVQQSQDQDRKLRDVAQSIVDGAETS